jgi:hypothetical protein
MVCERMLIVIEQSYISQGCLQIVPELVGSSLSSFSQLVSRLRLVSLSRDYRNKLEMRVLKHNLFILVVLVESPV